MGAAAVEKFDAHEHPHVRARRLNRVLARICALELLGDPGRNGPVAIEDIAGLVTALANKQPSGSYAPSSHIHDDRYPTDAEVAALLTAALQSYALAAHNHAGVYQPAGSYAAAVHAHDYAATNHNHAGIYQPADGDLDAIAALATQAFGRSLLTAADAAAARTLLQISAGGSDPWTYRKLAADYTNPLATFANVSDGTTVLQWTPPANSDWELEGRILIWTTAPANLPRVGFNVAGNAANGYGAVNLWQAGATASTAVQANVGWNNAGVAVNAQMAAGGVLNASTPYVCEVIAAGRSGASPQAMTVQMACETAAANVCFVKRGSFLKVRTI